MPIVSITRLHVRSWIYLPGFFLQTFRSARQASGSEGNIAAVLLRDRQNTFWTKTVWTTPEAMKAFMQSGVHGRVMKSLLEWCDEAALVSWNQDSREIPSWEDAHRRLQSEGRRSKVNHPSQSQIAYEIRPPRTGKFYEVRLK